MKKNFKRLLALALVFTLAFSLFAGTAYKGKTVILHSNDVHGAIADIATYLNSKRILRRKALL